MWIKASSEDTEGRFALWEQVHPPGYRAPPHLHEESVEAMYVLEGTYDFSVGEERISASAGSFVLVPAGLAHAFSSGPSGGRMLVLFAPGGYERYWEELSEAERQGPVSADAQAALARKHRTAAAG